MVKEAWLTPSVLDVRSFHQNPGPGRHVQSSLICGLSHLFASSPRHLTSDLHSDNSLLVIHIAFTSRIFHHLHSWQTEPATFKSTKSSNTSRNAILVFNRRATSFPRWRNGVQKILHSRIQIMVVSVRYSMLVGTSKSWSGTSACYRYVR